MGNYESALFDANRSLELWPTVEMALKKEDLIEKTDKNELNLKSVTYEKMLEIRQQIMNAQQVMTTTFM